MLLSGWMALLVAVADAGMFKPTYHKDEVYRILEFAYNVVVYTTRCSHI